MQLPHLTPILILVALAAEFFPPVAYASSHKDQLVSGGGKCSAAATQISWAALGEPLGGRMSGGGFVILGGGSSPPVGNSAPGISAFSPADKSRFYQAAVATLSVTATDSDNDPLQYRLLVDGAILQDWSSSATATWNTATASFGWHTVRVEVKDPTHPAVAQESRVFIFWRPPSP